MRNPTVMVALRDAEHVDSLMRLACNLSNGAKSNLVALHVIEVAPRLPLDADPEILDRPGKQVLSLARRVASEEFSRQVSTRLVRARQAGEAIVKEAKEHDADLLVIGYHQKHGPGEILLGSTVQFVARHAPCQVIVVIPPLEEYVSAAKERSDWGALMEEIS